jgi:hypothetical protein
VTLARHLRDQRVAQRSAAHSPRLPGIARAPGTAANSVLPTEDGGRLAPLMRLKGRPPSAASTRFASSDRDYAGEEAAPVTRKWCRPSGNWTKSGGPCGLVVIQSSPRVNRIEIAGHLEPLILALHRGDALTLIRRDTRLPSL